MKPVTFAVADAITDYNLGHSLKTISAKFGVGSSTIRRRFADAGVTVRPDGGPLKRQTIRIPRDPAVLGYVAGLLDGEGHVAMRKRTGRSDSGRVAIYSTTPAVIEWLHETFGGWVTWDHKRVERKGWKPMGAWSVHRNLDITAFLTAVLPYLIIKRDVAIAVLADLKRVAKIAA